MPRVRYTADGGHYRVAGYGFDPGDEHDVDADLAEYLTDRDDFEAVDEPDSDQSDSDAGNETEADAGDESEADGAFDVDAFLDRTPVDDVAADIAAGEVDEHLDAVAEAAERVTVQDAVGERRAELEG